MMVFIFYQIFKVIKVIKKMIIINKINLHFKLNNRNNIKRDLKIHKRLKSMNKIVFKIQNNRMGKKILNILNRNINKIVEKN